MSSRTRSRVASSGILSGQSSESCVSVCQAPIDCTSLAISTPLASTEHRASHLTRLHRGGCGISLSTSSSHLVQSASVSSVPVGLRNLTDTYPGIQGSVVTILQSLGSVWPLPSFGELTAWNEQSTDLGHRKTLLYTGFQVQHRCHHTSNTTCKHQVMYICHRFIMSAVHNRVGFNTSTNTGTGASPLKREKSSTFLRL